MLGELQAVDRKAAEEELSKNGIPWDGPSGAEEGSDHCDPYRVPETSITGGLQLACTVWVQEAEEKGGGRCFYLLLVLTCLEHCR